MEYTACNFVFFYVLPKYDVEYQEVSLTNNVLV